MEGKKILKYVAVGFVVLISLMIIGSMSEDHTTSSQTTQTSTSSDSVIIVNKTISQGCFEVTINKVERAWDGFRVYVTAKNIGIANRQERERFSPEGLALLDDQNNQYNEKYMGGELDSYTEIYPNVKKEGYVVFEEIPKTTKEIKLVFDVSCAALSYLKSFHYEYNISLTK